MGVPWPAWRLEAETIWFLGSWAPQVLLEATEEVRIEREACGLDLALEPKEKREGSSGWVLQG